MWIIEKKTFKLPYIEKLFAGIPYTLRVYREALNSMCVEN